MGKAALILVMAAGVTVTFGAISLVETRFFTSQHQAAFEEHVIAREIASSGFNAAMGILRSHGDDLQAGVLAVNGATGFLEGASQGGFYRAHARFISGHGVEVISTGFFGGSFDDAGVFTGTTHVMEDNFRHVTSNAPLHNQGEGGLGCSRLNARFLQSMAGWCSAVYLEQWFPDAPADFVPTPQMVFAPGRNRNGGQIPTHYSVIVPAGTQMNFFLAVRRDCRPAYGDFTATGSGARWLTYDSENHVFNRNHYDHIHYALDIRTGELDRLEESIWAMVEQHPNNRNRWRIAWEDQPRWNILDPNHRDFHNPHRSLMGLKMHGYGGNGWPTTDAWGYRTLRDYGNRPDFSDQVIEIWMEPATCPVAAGETGGSDGAEAPDSGGGTTPGGEAPPPAPGTGFTSDNCPCPGKGNKNHKVFIEHRPPGNPGNVRRICVAESAWPAHRAHGDALLCVGN